MPLKRWILHTMNRMNGIAGRPDLTRRTSRSSPVPGGTGTEPREPSLRGVPDALEPASPGPDHLGTYAPLIGAIRDELEHFVSSQLRLHLAIAERDRYLLTSIAVECEDDDEGGEVLRRFSREFTPEQVKRFLARDVIAHLPNASAIDLSQFAGLNTTETHAKDSDENDGYADLLAQLRVPTKGEEPRSFHVVLHGRWTETDASAATSKQRSEAAAAPAPVTPLAGSRLEVEIEDADGHRHLTLSSVVPNRRYAIGKGEGCDIAVNGAFASRRHCEIWLANGAWWAGDTGSTNGIRVESMRSVLGRSGAQTSAAGAKTAIEIVPGARIVLSALVQGEPADYPRVLLRQSEAAASPETPFRPGVKSPTTPVTPIAAPRLRQRELALTVTMASGLRTVPIGQNALPMSVGRSRNQDLVVDWAHEGVSGHHIDIGNLDDTGADVEVHGDNGVTIDGVIHPQGRRFRWRLGDRMTLGRASGEEPECTLLLSGKS